MHQNSYVDIKLSTSPSELQNYGLLWCVHIATEVLQTLHPGATGLRFYYEDLVGDIENALASNRQHAVAVKELYFGAPGYEYDSVFSLLITQMTASS